MKKILSISLILATLTLCAQNDATQATLRENPDIESTKGNLYVAPAIEYPSYINLKANHIDMNGADWSGLAAQIKSADSTRVNIVHIGDSHLQADMGTAVTRTRLGDHYGYAGRALVVPFKLAGTNEPVDYAITSPTPMTQARLLKTPWPIEMGFTGIAIQPEMLRFTLELSTRTPFDSIAVYYSGATPRPLNIDKYDSGAAGVLGIALDDTTSSAAIEFESAEPVQIHGFSLLNGDKGLAYNVIGNNGATFGTYNGVDGFAERISQFDPALIIISLGTNEAFNNISSDEMRQTIETMLNDIRRTSPNTKLLLTTPSECQRKTTRRRRRRSRVRYAINHNVKRMRDVILDVAEEQGIPVYDFYAVAGGNGSSNKWLADKTLNTDHIHLTRNGYTLQGHLFTDALEEALSK